jgi:hypothetical protein
MQGLGTIVKEKYNTSLPKVEVATHSKVVCTKSVASTQSNQTIVQEHVKYTNILLGL